MLTVPYPAGSLFWRARRLAPEDHMFPLRGMNSVADAWEPPARFVRSAGRLNKTNESLLYTCVDTPFATPFEIRVPDGERFSLMKFRATRQVSLTGIGLPIDPNMPSPFPDASGRLTSEFFARQFSRRVDDPENGEYYLSELVAKYNYDLPPEFHDGWLYPSTQMASALNATFRPETAHRKLELFGIAICTYDSQHGALRGQCYSDAREDHRGLTWHPQGSDIQREHFPEFG
jgi:hypothetical protein